MYVAVIGQNYIFRRFNIQPSPEGEVNSGGIRYIPRRYSPTLRGIVVFNSIYQISWIKLRKSNFL